MMTDHENMTVIFRNESSGPVTIRINEDVHKILMPGDTVSVRKLSAHKTTVTLVNGDGVT